MPNYLPNRQRRGIFENMSGRSNPLAIVYPFLLSCEAPVVMLLGLPAMPAETATMLPIESSLAYERVDERKECTCRENLCQRFTRTSNIRMNDGWAQGLLASTRTLVRRSSSTAWTTPVPMHNRKISDARISRRLRCRDAPFSLIPKEMVRFVKTLNAPAAGVFCEGEFGPRAFLEAGILPTARSYLQGQTSSNAVLCWNPGPIGTKSRGSSINQS